MHFHYETDFSCKRENKFISSYNSTLIGLYIIFYRRMDHVRLQNIVSYELNDRKLEIKESDFNSSYFIICL